MVIGVSKVGGGDVCVRDSNVHVSSVETFRPKKGTTVLDQFGCSHGGRILFVEPTGTPSTGGYGGSEGRNRSDHQREEASQPSRPLHSPSIFDDLSPLILGNGRVGLLGQSGVGAASPNEDGVQVVFEKPRSVSVTSNHDGVFPVLFVGVFEDTFTLSLVTIPRVVVDLERAGLRDSGGRVVDTVGWWRLSATFEGLLFSSTHVPKTT